jgi:hypothetical protein
MSAKAIRRTHRPFASSDRFRHSPPAESSAWGSGPVKYVRSVEVEDAAGIRFLVHEYRRGRFLSKTSHFRLDTGERVMPDGAGGFVIDNTGERLTPAK